MWWECNEDYAMGGVAMDGIVNRFPAFFPDQDLARLARHLHLGHASFYLYILRSDSRGTSSLCMNYLKTRFEQLEGHELY